MRSSRIIAALLLVPAASFAGNNKLSEGSKKALNEPNAKVTVAKNDPVKSDAAKTDGPKPLVAPKADGAKEDLTKSPSGKASTTKAIKKAPRPKPPCLAPANHFTAGSLESTFALTTCNGEVAPLAIEKLSRLAQPRWSSSPIDLDKGEPVTSALTNASSLSAPAARGRVDSGIALRLGAIAKHFGKAGKPAHFVVVSGYRPGSRGSLHATAKAFDVRVEGVRNETLVAYCKQLEDTGCGYYPNSTFVHIDVRRKSAGHVSWVDISGPGEDAHYVSSWPLKPGEREEPHVPTELVPKDLEDDGHGPTIEELHPWGGDRAVETTWLDQPAPSQLTNPSSEN